MQAALATPLDNSLDLLRNLSVPRTITVSLPPSLMLKLDATVKTRKLTRSFLVKCALEPMLDQMEAIQAREKETSR